MAWQVRGDRISALLDRNGNCGFESCRSQKMIVPFIKSKDPLTFHSLKKDPDLS